MASDPRARSGQPRPWGLYPGPAHPDDDDDDDLSPLLRIPVSPSVVTPSGTPPSPWLASTGSKPVGAVSRLSATRAWGGEPTASPASDEIPSHVPIFSRPGRIPEPSLDSQTLVGHQGSALQSPTVSLTQTGLVGFHRSFGSASLAMERSSFGLLPPENLSPGGEDSPTAHGQSERMSSLFANLSCRRPKSTLGPADQESAPARANEDVFKIPALPAHIVREKSMALAETSGFGIDQRFLQAKAGGLLESFLSLGGNSTLNQSSFAWEKILQSEIGQSRVEDEAEISLVGSLNLDEPVSDCRFEELNAKGPHDSFFNGQFSARSTSFGGSNEDSESRTRDEQFLDFSHLRQASRSNVDPGGSFLSGPEDFAALSQDLGDMDGEFEAFEGDQDKALAFLDGEEQEFKEEHKFVEYHEEKSTNLTGISCFSGANATFKPPPEDEDVLSRSRYFMQNSSRLGSLDSTLTGLNRPDLGFAPPREPVAERPPTVNSTFTVTDDESARIAEKVEAFKHLDVKTLQDLISRASSDHNPQYYASLIAQIAQKQALDVTSAQNATVSDLLPSFLDPDETQVLPQKSPAKPGELVPPKKSRIPIRSPKHAAMTSGIPIRKGSAPNVGSKKIVTGPRFSSPQKRYQRVSSKVEDTEERREKATKQLFKENRDPKVTSAKLEDTEERREKATKQLFKENCDPKTNCDPKATISETSCAVFPLDSDRSVMNWFSVILGRSEEQILVLRNKLERELTVNLMIRESKDFKIGLSTSQTLTLAPLSTLDVAVIFSPSDLDFCTGKLVIKPQGVSQPGGKTYKASILLQGQGGAPTLHFDGFGEVSNGKRSLHLGQISDLETHVVRRMRVENAGNAAAFIKLQGFRDEECRVTDDAYIALTPNEFVVEAKGAVSVALTLNPNLMTGDGSGSFLGSIALFHGPEVCRQVMLQARKVPGAARLSSSSSLLGLDFTQEFKGAQALREAWLQHVVDRDIRHFYNKTQREIIELIATKSARAGFSPLQVEETLSESRINCTFAPDATVNQTMYQPPLARANPKPAKTVYLAAETLYFPTTRVGTNSLTKVVLKNRTQSPATFHVEDIKLPFKNKHKTVTVQPNAFMNVPIFYAPTNAGPHQTAVTFRGREGRNLVAILKGSTPV